MNPEQLIILYSKYSPQCKPILSLLDTHAIDYMRLLCIDNVDVREQLLQSTHLNVRTVPCVLFMYPGGRVEKFEGPNVSEWILKQVSKHFPSPVLSSTTPTPATSASSTTPIGPTTSASSTTPIGPATSSASSVIASSTEVTPLESVPVLIDQEQERIAPQPSSKKTSISDIAASIASSRDTIDIEYKQRLKQ